MNRRAPVETQLTSPQPGRMLSRASLAALYALLLWAPLASGGHRGWPLAVTQLLALLGLLLWVLSMLSERRLEWRRTALDLPLGLLIALVLLQLAMGNRPLAAWALAPSLTRPEIPVALPTPFFALGTISPTQTFRSLLLFLSYIAVYVLVVNLIRRRHELERLVCTLLFAGSGLAFLALLDYTTGRPDLIWWRNEPFMIGRLPGTFANATHFASWLAMLVCLGLGYVSARRAPKAEDFSLASLLGEHNIRRSFPFLGVGVMTLALVFTLSRGGVVGLLLALGVLVALLHAFGLGRWSVILVGGLLVVTLGAGALIGLDPLVVRFRIGEADLGKRWIQTVSSLPILSAFPLFGVGLGAYKDIYFRYQPPALKPGEVYYPYAHNDLLQFVVELGPLGAALGVFAVWRVGRDLLGVHLLGRGRCPVGGGEGPEARRSDPFAVSIALGALGGVVALLAHSGFDFSARIPANGILAATCLGIASVAFHTRFSSGQEQLLTAVRSCSLGTGRLLPGTAGAAAIALAVAVTPLVIRPALAETKLRAATGLAALGGVGEALALDPRDPRIVGLHARLGVDAAVRMSSLGLAPDGRTLTSWETRQSEALKLLSASIRDFRTALTLTPSDPFLHERLAWAHGTVSTLDASLSTEHLASALTHLNRAIALAPENPFLYRSLAVLAVTRPEPLVEVGLRAARDAIRRDPSLLTELADRFLPAGLSDAQWPRLVPDSSIDQLELAVLLEARGLAGAAGTAYRQAVKVASPADKPLAHWMLAKFLIGEAAHREAIGELDAALKLDSSNPELQMTRGDALVASGDPAALEAYRAAVVSEQATARKPARDRIPFSTGAPRARALVSAQLRQTEGALAVRYHRAYAQYLTDRQLWEQALKEWETVVAVAPRDPRVRVSRGIVLDSLGARERALDDYRTAVSLDGRNHEFRMRLAQSLWSGDYYYQAIDEWRAVLGQEPRHVAARLALAQAYVKIGERSRAAREYAEILQIAPGHSGARQGLARLEGVQ